MIPSQPAHFRILELIDQNCTLHEISAKTGYAFITVQNYVYKFQKAGYIKRDGQRQIVWLTRKGHEALERSV